MDDDRDGVPDEWTSFYNELNGKRASIGRVPERVREFNHRPWRGRRRQRNSGAFVRMSRHRRRRQSHQDDAFPLEPTQTTDSDGDGFGDNIGGVDGDECYLVPGVAEGTPTFAGGTGRGCPLFNDIDSDGVGDDDDQCPNTDAGAAVDAAGCALNQLDSDNDGVKDDEDRCPNTLDFRTIDAFGCDTQQQNVDSDEDA